MRQRGAKILLSRCKIGFVWNNLFHLCIFDVFLYFDVLTISVLIFVMCQYKTSCVQIVGHGGQQFSKRGQEALWSGLWALWRTIWTVFDAIRFWFELRFKPSIANKAQWLWNLINFFVPGFCYRFSALTVHNHNSFWSLFEKQTNRNVALNCSAIQLVWSKKQKIVQGRGMFNVNINCTFFVIAFELCRVSQPVPRLL